MRFLLIALSLIISTLAFADRPVQSARMGKVGSLHQNSWRISEELDKKGKGENYTFSVSIFKDEVLCDYFSFTLNEGAKNTKKSQFSIQGDVKKENFGSEVSMEVLSISKGEASLKLELSTKILDHISFINGEHCVIFSNAQIDNNIALKVDAPLSFSFNKENNISIKIEMAK